MDLINPFTQTVVVFGLPEPRDTVEKAARHANGHYAVVWPPQSSVVVAPRMPSGKHLGRGGSLTVVRRGKRGRQSPGLEHYSKAYAGSLMGALKSAESQAVRGKTLATAARKPGGNKFQSPGRHGRKIYNITP